VKRILFMVSALVLAAAAPVAAQKGSNAVSITSKPAKVVFGKTTTISGQVTGSGNAGVKVDLEGATVPSTTTDANGNYSFTVTPQQTTAFKVTAKTKPPVTSGEATVTVALKVGMRVSDRTPSRGEKVRFFGSVWPAHDGKTASLQRRTSSGWKTVATATTIAAAPVNGVTRSTYSIARRIRRTGTYRVVVDSGDTDHADGRSRKRRLRVH
jgi:hypothetical protein